MPREPGPYDSLARLVANEIGGAKGVAVLVYDGPRGTGAAVHVETLPDLRRFPAHLRALANAIEQEIGGPE